MKKLSLLPGILLIIACLGIVTSNVWAASLAPRMVAPARYMTGARPGLRMPQTTVTRFYHSPALRNQVQYSLIPTSQRLAAPLVVSQPVSIGQCFYATGIQHDAFPKTYKRGFVPPEIVRTSQAAIEQSKKDIEVHRKIIADLEAKIKKSQQKITSMQKAIATYAEALEQLLKRLEETAGEGTVFIRRLHNAKIVGQQKSIKHLEQLIEHEEHHIKSLQTTLDHQKKLKAEAAQVPQHEAARNAANMQSTQQRLLKGKDLVAIAAKAQETAELKRRLQTASIEDKESLTYHFITKDNIGVLARSEYGSELLQALVQSANNFALDVRAIRATIAVQALDDTNISAIANDPYGLAFLKSLISEYIGKDRISELLVDAITLNNIDEIANDEYGIEFLKKLWDTDNEYVKDHIKGLNKLQLLTILQKPRMPKTKSIGARIADYFAAWTGPVTSERVQ